MFTCIVFCNVPSHTACLLYSRPSFSFNHWPSSFTRTQPTDASTRTEASVNSIFLAALSSKRDVFSRQWSLYSMLSFTESNVAVMGRTFKLKLSLHSRDHSAAAFIYESEHRSSNSYTLQAITSLLPPSSFTGKRKGFTMMLMLERWSPDHKQSEPLLELAMLLDEAPMFGFSATKSGEPWRMDSTLTEASRSADLNGYAWLYAVFLTDPPATWGFRKVRISADGSIMRSETTVSGVHTGRLLLLKYEVVAKHIFRNLCGNDTTGAYKVLLEAYITTYAEAEGKENPQLQEKDPLLGFADRKHSEDLYMTEPSPHPAFADKELGCLVTWEDHHGHQEKWYVCHVEAFVEYRFYFTEFQRRPFVKVIMEQLGFVEGSNIQTFEEVCTSHLNNIANSMKALSEIDASKRFAQVLPEDQRSVKKDGKQKPCSQS